MLDVEEAYSTYSATLKREWELLYLRDMTRKKIEQAESTQELASILINMDQGFSQPYSVRVVG